MLEIKVSRIIGKKRKVILRGLPEKWAEVTPVQARKLFPYILHPQKSDVTLVKVLQIVLGLPRSLFLSFSDAQVYDMVRCLDWMHTEILDESILPDYRHRGRLYHLPKSKMANVMCIEYQLADEYYTRFLEKSDENDLDKLCAVLMRPADSDKKRVLKRDDARAPLTGRREVEQRAENFARLPQAVKLYCLAFFSGCKLFVYKSFGDDIFEKNETEAGEEGSDPEETAVDFGWYGTFQAVAEDGIFGNLDAVIHDTNFFELCVYLVRKKRQHDKALSEQNKRIAALEQ